MPYLKTSRRVFIRSGATMAVTLGSIPAAAELLRKASLSASTNKPDVSTYRCLSSWEAAFVEALVNALCPSDHLSPSGVDCGLGLYIDKLLVTKTEAARQSFRSGIAAANAESQKRYGLPFHQLALSDAQSYLHDIGAAGPENPEHPLALWKSQGVDPILIEASFLGPVYDKYSNRVFWKVFGYTGEHSYEAG
jgi:gluconate 2-dehydrogenase gamma chain